MAVIVLSVIVSFLVRCLLVALFLPFSAMDKLLNRRAAIDQAQATVRSRTLAAVLIAAGLFVEVVMSAAILGGLFDRLAAVILAGYCAVTALLWKQFWKSADFRLKGSSNGRDVFWDFLKNLAVAGGFLMFATGGNASGVYDLIRHPLSSSHPYRSALLSADMPNVHRLSWFNAMNASRPESRHHRYPGYALNDTVPGA